MGKSLVAQSDLEAGHVLTLDDIAMKSPGGGPGSFVRNVDLWTGFWGNQPHDASARHAMLIPPECKAGPSVFDAVDFDGGFQALKMVNAQNITMYCPTFGCCKYRNEPTMLLENCKGMLFFLLFGRFNSNTIIFYGTEEFLCFGHV